MSLCSCDLGFAKSNTNAAALSVSCDQLRPFINAANLGPRSPLEADGARGPVAYRVQVEERLVMLHLGGHSSDGLHILGIRQVEMRKGGNNRCTWQQEDSEKIGHVIATIHSRM